ncbi:MAG: site-2 protease family protein, partial [Planctomycetaceae bacterium]
MNNRSSSWLIPLGTWFGVSVHVSLLFILIIPAFCMHLGGVRTGLTFSLILFLSVLLHEFMHILAARSTGGFGETVQITPFGGLAMCHPAPTLSSQLWTPAAGPVSNLALCLITAVPLWQLGDLSSALNPFVFPETVLAGSSLLPGLTMLVFKANWVLVLINLIPVHPLDGGRFLLTWLSHRKDGIRSRGIYIKAGSITGALIVLSGLLLSSPFVMLIGTMVLVLNVYEMFQLQSQTPEAEESFLGYDFSQGYTSLEKESAATDHEPGLIDRWKSQRDEKRRQREEREEREMAGQLDRILDKLHQHGED